MTKSQREKLRALLQQMRSAAVKSGPHRIEPNRTDEAAVGVADEDAQALSEMLQAISSSRNKGQAAMLQRIDRALLKLRDSPEDYGLCEECEEEIAPRRLQLMPYAILCAECQAKADPRRGGTRRSVTEYKD